MSSQLTTVKREIISEHGLHNNDTGSSQVQFYLLSNKIELLAKHLKIHPKDVPTRRSLLKLVARRKKMAIQANIPLTKASTKGS